MVAVGVGGGAVVVVVAAGGAAAPPQRVVVRPQAEAAAGARSFGAPDGASAAAAAAANGLPHPGKTDAAAASPHLSGAPFHHRHKRSSENLRESSKVLMVQILSFKLVLFRKLCDMRGVLRYFTLLVLSVPDIQTESS